VKIKNPGIFLTLSNLFERSKKFIQKIQEQKNIFEINSPQKKLIKSFKNQKIFFSNFAKRCT
jgi:hypothetical protein